MNVNYLQTAKGKVSCAEETFREKHLSLLQARHLLLEEEENDFGEDRWCADRCPIELPGKGLCLTQTVRSLVVVVQEMLPDCFEIWVSRHNVLEDSYQILQEVGFGWKMLEASPCCGCFFVLFVAVACFCLWLLLLLLLWLFLLLFLCRPPDLNSWRRLWASDIQALANWDVSIYLVLSNKGRLYFLHYILFLFLFFCFR